MRHLYNAAATDRSINPLIDEAKDYERRRCGHHPDDHPTPLTAKDCLASVVDPKSSGTNKHRYVVASQEQEVRRHMRGVLGVPLIYINRSVMIMEPMAEGTAGSREKEERIKFRAGLKRKRGAGDEGRDERPDVNDVEAAAASKPKKKAKGPKGPNPLSVKKPKKKQGGDAEVRVENNDRKEGDGKGSADQETDLSAKRKRKRKRKSTGNVDADVPPGSLMEEQVI